MKQTVVVAGASGCVGKRLVSGLAIDGYEVVALCRRPAQVDWPSDEGVTTVAVDLADREATRAALAACGATSAFYLVHSMGGDIASRDDFVARDKMLAASFSDGVRASEIEHVVYLGGHVPDGDLPSDHLRSRSEVADILRGSGAAVTELRAGVVIDLESAAFRMLGAIIDKQKALLIPPQFRSLSHPIAIDDATQTLVAALRLPVGERDVTFDIGCETPCRYSDLIAWYAEALGIEPTMLDVPWAPRGLIVPYVASLTGEPFGLVWALSGSWGIDLPLHDERFYEHFPELARTPAREAVLRAVRQEGCRTQIHPSRSARAAS